MAPTSRFVCLGILSFFLTFLATCNAMKQQGVYKHGNVIIGGLFPIHLRQINETCIGLRPEALVWSEAMILAIEMVNRNSSFLPHITLGYDIQDTCGTEQVAISSAAQFSFINNLMFDERYKKAVHACSKENTTRPSIIAVLGGEDSRVSVNMANVLQLGNIPQISYGSTSSQLSNKDKFTTFFRTVPSDEFQSQAMAQIVKSNQWSCVAVIGTDDIYGRSGVDSFVYSAKEQNICIALRELFPVYDLGGQVTELVRKLRTMTYIEIIILYSLPAQAVKIFEESLKQNMVGKTWIASDGWAKSAYIRQKQFIPIIKGTLGLEFRDIHFDTLQKHLKNITSNSHQHTWWEEFWNTEFNCSSYRSPNNSLCSGLERITPDFYEKKLHSPLSAYVVDAVYTVANALKVLQNCSGRKCFNVSDVTPERMVEAIKRTSFNGLTGHFDFSEEEKQARYDIINLQVNKAGLFQAIKVGQWDSKQLKLNYSVIQWRNGIKPRLTCGSICPKGTYKSGKLQCISECVQCSGDKYTDIDDNAFCKPCSKGFIHSNNHTSCAEVAPMYIHWNDPWGIGLLFVNCVGIFASIIVFGLILKNYKTPIITETGGFLNVALTIAMFLSYGFNFVLLSKPTDTRCAFLAIWFYVVYPGCIVLFLLKIHFIRHCFDTRQDIDIPGSRATLTPNLICHFYLGAIAAIIFPVLMSVIWAVMGNLHSSKVVISRDTVYLTCASLNTPVGLFLRYINIVYLFTMTVGTTVYSHRIKKMSQAQKFRESKHLFYALSIFLVTLATFYPGWALIQGPVLQVFACSTNIIAATGVILCAYGPKVHLMLLYPVLNTYAHVHPVHTSVTSAAINMGLQLVDTGRGRTITLLDDSTPSHSSPERARSTVISYSTSTPPMSSHSTHATDA